MDTSGILALVVVALAGITLVWCIYHAGKANQKVEDTIDELTRVVKEEEAQDELERNSKENAREAIAAGDAAGDGPDDPDELPPEVRARILRP